MDIDKLVIGKEYFILGNTTQKIKITNIVGEDIRIEYTSDDCSKGLKTSINEIECNRYVREICGVDYSYNDY